MCAYERLQVGSAAHAGNFIILCSGHIVCARVIEYVPASAPEYTRLMCTVGVQASVRLDVLLIVCQAKMSFKKSVQRAPYGALMLGCAVKRGRDGGKENEGREGEKGRQNEEAFSLAFLPLSLSSPMSKTDGAGVLCVFAYRGTCKCRLM